MTLDDFVKAFAEQFDELAPETINKATMFKEVEGYSSLVALSVLNMVDKKMGKDILLADLMMADTVEDLYDVILSK